MIEYLDGLIRTSLDPVAGQTHAAAWALDFGIEGVPQVHVLEALTALPPRPPLPNELFLWFGTPASDDWQALLPCLVDAEREQVLRLRQTTDRWSVAATRAGLRTLLSTALGCPAHEVAYWRDDREKPWLDRSRHGELADRLHFNVSHTRGLVAVALAGRPVGVDVEAFREMRNLQALAARAFADENLPALAAVENEAARAALFYRLWTLGEAFIKATGEGLAQGLKTFQFNTDGPPRLLRVSKEWAPPSRWRFGVWPKQ